MTTTEKAPVPTLRLSQYTEGDGDARRAFSSALYEALKATGFVIITDHGIDLDRLHDSYRTVEEFFALPAVEKTRYMVGKDGQRGYTPFGREHAKGNPHPDLKEFWHVGRDEIAPNVWPVEPAAFEAEVAWLYRSLDDAGLTLLEALTQPLELEANYFAKMAEGGNSILRLLHYPPIAEGADPHCVRAAAHEDINLITLLVAASASGLELLDRNGKWQAIDAPQDSIIVDAGDMLARITNGHISATTHRVVNPDGPNQSRYSMPFFLHPRPDAILSCMPQFRDGTEAEDITGAGFLAERLAEIGLK
ncbi:isopenicillin N synthase family dioxygenase [Parvularcula sp. LCG005]|uniref:isopenicillin N synthase family dioxygenase n=1 Tax=Parvularcula sp. LCG005 TaxID=3078805 RepID=UPI00294376D4|nr:2-oxoglutarate and iron-dependent oxygenase domain-containing protein [Parvularcula sp. LCG005]WOI53697.1 2-oxoglutarate and iron-dependent oxygenase domain-containing protein [Parvularcula sp. LCG005]